MTTDRSIPTTPSRGEGTTTKKRTEKRTEKRPAKPAEEKRAEERAENEGFAPADREVRAAIARTPDEDEDEDEREDDDDTSDPET